MKLTVDDLDGRFWSFHSASPTQLALRAVRAKVSERRDLDFVWLPSQHLRRIRPGNRPSFVKADFKRAAEGSEPWNPPQGLPNIYIAMGRTAENVAQLKGVSRQAQDEWGVLSQTGGQGTAMTVERLG